LRDRKKLELTRHKCGRCLQEKEVVDFFFDWRCASGLYRLCEGCVNELKNVFPKKPFGVRKEKSFFENIREAIKIVKRFFQ
jgi:hypothetical protein